MMLWGTNNIASKATRLNNGFLPARTSADTGVHFWKNGHDSNLESTARNTLEMPVHQKEHVLASGICQN